MLLAQGFTFGPHDELLIPNPAALEMTIPTDLIPLCPDDGSAMTTNLRADDRFVEDDGWHTACQHYHDFLDKYGTSRIVYFELGVGFNTPSIIKYNLWRRTYDNEKAIYICLNKGQAGVPSEITDRSICIDGDIAAVLRELNK